MNNNYEVADSVNDKCFDFGDYSYIIEDASNIQPDEYRSDEMKVKAIQLANPWNKQFILDKITI